LNLLKKVLSLCLSGALVISSNLGRADDIEIYFNSGNSAAATSVIRSNVLFILDTSGSMGLNVPATGRSRLKEMQEAVKLVLNNSEDINVGLMRFKTIRGGAVIYPTSDIGGNVSDVVGFTGSTVANQVVKTAFIDSELDDAEEVVTNLTGGLPRGSVALTDATLDAFDFGGTQSVAGGEQTFKLLFMGNDGMEETRNGGCAQFFRGATIRLRDKWPYMYTGDAPRAAGPSIRVDGLWLHKCVLLGLRYPGITIPRGETILSAFIDFTCRKNFNHNTNVAIVGQDVGDAARMTGFGTNVNDISSRNQTSATQRWNLIPSCSASRGDVLTTPNIKDIVQEIVNRPDWATGQSMFFRFQQSSTPLLSVRNPASGLTGSRTQGASNNSARQFFSMEKSPSFAPRLRVVTAVGTPVAGQDQKIALRFSNIRIPRRARVTKVKLTLTPNAAPGVPVATTWTVASEASDDSPPLESRRNNISSRRLNRGADAIDWTISRTTLTTPDAPEESPNIRKAIQKVVDRRGWCGGNALTLVLDTPSADVNQTRFLHSFDSDPSKAPRLTYTFETGTPGCMKAHETAQTGLSGDDAEQVDVNVDTIDDDLDIGFDNQSGNEQTVGLRFRDIDIPKNATILDAAITFTSKGVSPPGNAIFTIKGIDQGNVAQFSNTANDITSRPTTSARTVWNSGEWNTGGVAFESDDLTPIVQEIVNRGDWVSGNTMGFVIGCSSTPCNSRVAETADGDAAKSPRIRIIYESVFTDPFKTNREAIIEQVQALPALGATPIIPALAEAARYWRGEKIFSGLHRRGFNTNRVSHPGSYCTAPGACRGATIDSSTDVFGVNRRPACNMSGNPDSDQCNTENIRGNPSYISPFNPTLSCSTNHQVLLSDGSASETTNDDINYIKSLPGVVDCKSRNRRFKKPGEPEINYSDSEICGVDLVRHLFEEDQSSLPNRQIVKTHTVAFNTADAPGCPGRGRCPTQYLKDLANVGGGEFHFASSAADLVTAFENILTEVKNDPTSFVSPALATNAFNRLLSRDEVYFGLFTPNLARAWEGNVKKYRICVKSGSCSLGTIIDANDVEAIDPANDKFKDTAQSIWSDVVDGRATTLGGAGHEIVNFNNQILYTDKNNFGYAVGGQLLNGAGFKLKQDNWDDTNLGAMRAAVCPTPSTSNGSDCEKRMLYLLGKKNTTNPDTDISTTQRWSVNDVLHSSPVVITYNGRDTNNDGVTNLFFDKLLYGTNDGALHMVNAETGVEEWRFMPSDFWGQQQQIFTNAQGNHIYGIDVSPTIQIIDINDNNIIESLQGDKVRAFVSTRRGGSNMYALDVSADIITTTDTVTPRLLWRIQGGSGDFPRLGQTWSKPILSTIAIETASGTELREVLIFGGGYDASLDNPATYSTSHHAGAPFMGNAIYIVDAESGNKILSISGSPGGADIIVPDMNFSIPSSVRAVDSDSDGADDKLYVGDTGGQIWRVDLAPIDLSGIYSSTAGETVVGKLANISQAGVPAEQRRFFEPPSVIQVRDARFSNEQNYDYILMGTGYRAHPLNTAVRDRFYAIRDFQTGANEMVDLNDNNISDATEGYPQSSGDAFTNSDLINITTTILDSADATHRGSAGWFYDFTQAGAIGEKVLSPAITLGGAVTFTTFAPEAASSTPDPCTTSIGLGKAYNFDILSADAALDWDADGAITNNDRRIELTGGIPSGVVPVFTPEGVIGIVGVEGGTKQLGKLADISAKRSHWQEKVEF